MNMEPTMRELQLQLAMLDRNIAQSKAQELLYTGGVKPKKRERVVGLRKFEVITEGGKYIAQLSDRSAKEIAKTFLCKCFALKVDHTNPVMVG